MLPLSDSSADKPKSSDLVLLLLSNIPAPRTMQQKHLILWLLQVAFVTGNLKLRLNVEQNPGTHHVGWQSYSQLPYLTSLLCDYLYHFGAPSTWQKLKELICLQILFESSQEGRLITKFVAHFHIKADEGESIFQHALRDSDPRIWQEIIIGFWFANITLHARYSSSRTLGHWSLPSIVALWVLSSQSLIHSRPQPSQPLLVSCIIFCMKWI